MTQEKLKLRAIVTACSLAFAGMSGFASAQVVAPVETEVVPITAEDARSAAEDVRESLEVVAEMEQEEGLGELMAGAHGVFIVPDYGRAGLGIGARGGEGVLMVRQNGEWAGPIFYDMGGISAGVQAGIEGGHLAFILNTERAVNSFMQENNWSLNADAGLTVLAWSARAQAAAGKGDVTVWSNTAGLFGDLAISVTDINFDEEETASYYGTQLAVADIIEGKVVNPHAAALRQALAAATAGPATGGVATGATVGGQGVAESEEGFVERGVVGEEGVTEGGGIVEEGEAEIEQGVEATGGAIEEGAETTGGMIQEGAAEVEQGVEATGGAVERGAEATGDVIQEGAAETESAVEQGASRAGITEGETEVRGRSSTGY